MECYTEEVWRPIAGYEGRYEVSDCGRVRSVSRAVPSRFGLTRLIKSRDIKPYVSQEGYPKVALRGDSAQVKHHFIHRLVAVAFIPNPDNKPEINHIDVDRTNSNAVNLEWCTRRENVDHSWKFGDMRHGTNHPESKLTAEDVRAIRRLREAGLSFREIGKRFPVNESGIRKVVKRMTYKDVQ